MDNNKYKQKGTNSAFPQEVETWIWGEDIPEWLSDLAKIGAINGETNKIYLEHRDLSSGGYELLDSSGQHTLVRASSKKDYICRDLSKKKGGLFVLTPLQFNLIYYGTENL
ncbi:MAG: hypothetical protein IJ880_02400 [Bacilli bacterium]|nr:hypothetical protein [Bacilli bacterium]